MQASTNYRTAGACRYHHWLGFAAVIVYLRDDLLQNMLQQDAIRKAIKERILYIVRWDDIQPFPFDETQFFDQVFSVATSYSMACFHPVFVVQAPEAVRRSPGQQEQTCARCVVWLSTCMATVLRSPAG